MMYKSEETMQLLVEEKKKEENWGQEKIRKLAEITGLTPTKIYKWSWNYDQKYTLKYYET